MTVNLKPHDTHDKCANTGNKLKRGEPQQEQSLNHSAGAKSSLKYWNKIRKCHVIVIIMII